VVGEHNGRKVIAFEAALLKARNNAITKGDVRSIKAILELCERYNALNPASENASGERRTGVLVVPTVSVSGEEWEREHGPAARGKPPPPDLTAPPAQPAPPPPREGCCRRSELTSCGPASALNQVRWLPIQSYHPPSRHRNDHDRYPE